MGRGHYSIVVDEEGLHEILRRQPLLKQLNFSKTHNFRKTAMVDCLNAGLAVNVISNLVGHKSIKTTCDYL